jgi:hypothetical protein
MKGIWLLYTYIPASANRRATAMPALQSPTKVSYSAMFQLLRQNMELSAFHSLLHERDLVVHLHSRIGQPSSHSNVSTVSANNSVVIQRHVPVIAAEHGTNSIS